MTRRTRFAAWLMAGWMISAAAGAQAADGDEQNDAADAEGGDIEGSVSEGDEIEDFYEGAVPDDAAFDEPREAISTTGGYHAPSHANEPTSPALNAGRQAFTSGDLQGASIAFYDALMEADPDSVIAQHAQYQLMRTLSAMGLYYGARLIADDIIDVGPTHAYFQEVASVMLDVAEKLPGDDEVLGRLAAFSELFPSRIPPEQRDTFAFLLGKYNYTIGELDAAVDYFKAVSPDSAHYHEALFTSAITHVRQYDADGASGDLKTLLRYIEDSPAAKRKELRPVAQLAQVTMARMFYSTGEYDKSTKYYEAIKQSSNYWLDSLFESSWAYFQLDEYNHALGNLHSLNSPFFDDQYYPEAPVLQAVIFFYNCQFDQVRLALDEFRYVYSPLKDELQITIDGFLDNEEAFTFLEEARKQKGDNHDFDPRLQQIVAAALGDRVLSSSVQFLDQLQKELDYVQDAPDSWSRSDLGDFLYGEMVGQLALSRQSTGALVRKRLADILVELSARDREAAAILVETDLAEADALSSEMSAELSAEGVKSLEDARVHADKEHMVWRFDGEYWRDELGYYFYHIESKCLDRNAD